jgi:hypothetical protein
MLLSIFRPHQEMQGLAEVGLGDVLVVTDAKVRLHQSKYENRAKCMPRYKAIVEMVSHF